MQVSVVLSLVMAALIGNAAVGCSLLTCSYASSTLIIEIQAAKITCGCEGIDYITGADVCITTTFDTAQYKDCTEACVPTKEC